MCCGSEFNPGIEKEGQDSFSYRLARSRVRGVLSSETSNTGNPFRSCRIVIACCNPHSTDSDSTAPNERFRSPAIDFAVSRISSSMFNVVLVPEKSLQ